MANNNSTRQRPNFKDLTGQTFDKWTVLDLAPRDTWKSGRTQWRCQCVCGVERNVFSDSLLRGMSNGCPSCSSTTHGEIWSPEYMVWKAMRQRCNCPTTLNYHDYGGRGITICKRWDNFVSFLADMGPRPSSKHSIDRIDNNRGYYPENCRWTTTHIQARNKRNNRLLSLDGRTQCIRDWENETHIHYNTIWNRLDRGWTVVEALTTPPRAPRKQRT